ALIGDDNDLAAHLRCPVQAQMRSGSLDRLMLGHGGEIIANLIGHEHQFIELAGRHAANPPVAFSVPPSKHKAWSRRATATMRTPKRWARSSASEVGAETDTRVPAPKIAAFATISNEQRLVMTKKPLSGATPARASAPIALSSALCRPTSSRTRTIAPSGPHQAAAWTARVA